MHRNYRTSKSYNAREMALIAYRWLIHVLITAHPVVSVCVTPPRSLFLDDVAW